MSEKIAKGMIDEHTKMSSVDATWLIGVNLRAFDPGDKVVVILESEYERLVGLSDACRMAGEAGGLLTTKAKYDALVRLAAEHGYVVDGDGFVTRAGDK